MKKFTYDDSDWHSKIDAEGCMELRRWERDPSSKPREVSVLIRHKILTDEEKKQIEDLNVQISDLVDTISSAVVPTDQFQSLAELESIIQIEWPKQMFMHGD